MLQDLTDLVGDPLAVVRARSVVDAAFLERVEPRGSRHGAVIDRGVDGDRFWVDIDDGFSAPANQQTPRIGHVTENAVFDIPLLADRFKL